MLLLNMTRNKIYKHNIGKDYGSLMQRISNFLLFLSQISIHQMFSPPTDPKQLKAEAFNAIVEMSLINFEASFTLCDSVENRTLYEAEK